MLMLLPENLVGITVIFISFGSQWVVCFKALLFQKPQRSCFNFLTIWGNGLCRQHGATVHIRQSSIVSAFSSELQSLKS